MKPPKNLADYCDVERAAQGLRDFADDLVRQAEPGTLIKWDLNVRQWHPDWANDGRRIMVLAARSGASQPTEEPEQ